MSVNDLNKAFDLIKENPDDSSFEGVKSDELILKAENTLGLCLPPTYREFLRRLGAGDIAGQEFYGIIDDDFIDSGVPDAIWFTLHARKNYGLPDDLVVVFSIDDGSYIALNAHKSDSVKEAEIVLWHPSDPDSTEFLFDDFGSFFLERITEALEY